MPREITDQVETFDVDDILAPLADALEAFDAVRDPWAPPRKPAGAHCFLCADCRCIGGCRCHE
jgi:hypothetical protein